MNTDIASQPSELESEYPTEVSERDLVRHMANRKMRERTIATYLYHLRKLEGMTGKALNDIRGLDLRLVAASDKWGNYGTSTRGGIRAALKVYIELSERTDLLGGPFWASEKSDKAAKKRYIKEHTPSTEEMARVRVAVEHDIMHGRNDNKAYVAGMVMFAANFGLRAFGISCLRMCDVHLNEGFIYVPETKGGDEREVHLDLDITDLWGRFMERRKRILKRLLKGRRIGQANGGKSSTSVPYDQDTQDRLRYMLEDDKAPVFFFRTQRNGAQVGAPIGAGGIVSAAKRYLYGLTVRDITEYDVTTGKVHTVRRGRSGHDFRHGKIHELLIEQGRDPIGVLAYVGHESLDTTMGYIDVGLDVQRAAFAKDPKPLTRNDGDVDLKSAAMKNLNNLLESGKIDAETYAKAIANL